MDVLAGRHILWLFLLVLLFSLVMYVFFGGLGVASFQLGSECVIVDVYNQKGGQGLNVSSGSFKPNELVLLYALVTFNGTPQPYVLVAFDVIGPDGNVTTAINSYTNMSGVANMSFRIPPYPSSLPAEKVFGTWLVHVVVCLFNEVAVDDLVFRVVPDDLWGSVGFKLFV